MLSDAEYVRGFALFMSELFVHMIPPVITTRFSILGQAVREMLLTLLEHPTPANVKCLCQILKVVFASSKSQFIIESGFQLSLFSSLGLTLKIMIEKFMDKQWIWMD